PRAATPPSTLSLHDALPISAPFDPTADLGAPFDPFVGIEPADDPFAALRGQPPGTGNQPEWSPGLGFVTERAPKAPASRARFELDRKSTRLNSSHVKISYAV